MDRMLTRRDLLKGVTAAVVGGATAQPLLRKNQRNRFKTKIS